MPIPMETKPVVTNAVYIPMIVIQTGISEGKLRTSCQITLADAKEEKDVWEGGGVSRTFYIPDVMNLEEDLKALAPQIASLFEGIVLLTATVNSIRKVL